MKISFIFFIVILICKPVHSQGDEVSEHENKYINVIPKTPTATNFLKYGNIDVNKSLGQPNISIPLYNIEVDGVNIPVSISYDASGIRVDELANVVGLKWRLNAGGGFFRTINNLPDENGWTTNGYTSLDDSWYTVNEISDYITQRQLAPTHPITNQPSLIDHSPDDFGYSFLNFNGNFIFKRKDIYTLWKDKNNNLEINAISTNNDPSANHNLAKFEVKDISGNVFLFEKVEFNGRTTISGTGSGNLSPSSQNTYKSSWLISHIDTKNDFDIDFEYTEYQPSSYFLTKRSQTIKRQPSYGNSNSSSACFLVPQQSGDYSTDSHEYTESFTATYNYPTVQLIKRIVTPNKNIIFYYSDYNSGITENNAPIWEKKLDSISILENFSNQKIKSYHFNYSSFLGDPRLKLESVLEIGKDDENSKPPYEFKYYNENEELPLKNSYSRDYFGYYNGQNNESLIPFTPAIYANIHSMKRDKIADRKPYLEHLITGTLEEIKYPTGGRTKFKYELNQEQKENLGPFNYLKGEAMIQISMDPLENTDYYEENGNRVYYKNFSIPDGILFFSDNNINVEIVNNVDDYDPSYPNIDIQMYNICSGTSFCSEESVIIEEGLAINKKSQFLAPSSSYRMEIVVPGNLFPNNYNPSLENILFKLKYSWMYEILESQDENTNLGVVDHSEFSENVRAPFYSGGLRIKEIKDFEESNPNGECVTRKEYFYQGLNGQSFNESNYSESIGFDLFNIYTISSDPMIHKRFNNSGFYYSKVDEITYSNNNCDSYSLTGDSSYKVSSHFERDYINYKYRGRLVSESYFNSNNDLIKKKVLSYDDNQTNHYYNILGKKNLCYNIFDNHYLGYNIGENSIYTEYHSQLITKAETNYFENENITIINHFEYNENELLKKKNTIFGANELQPINEYDMNNYSYNNTDVVNTELNYSYVTDYLSFYNNLVYLKNVKSLKVSAILKESQTNKILQGRYYSYDSNGNPISIHDFNKYANSNINTPSYIPSSFYKISDLSFSDNGALLEFKTPEGITKSYIWNFNETLVLAEIENISQQELNSQFDLTNVGFTSLNNTLENQLRNNSDSKFIKTYSYYLDGQLRDVVDSRGKRTTFKYDSLLRPIEMIDDNNMLINSYKYNYRSAN